MTEKKFSKREAVRFGWQVMKQNLGFFIGLLIVVNLIYIFSYISSVVVWSLLENPILAFILDFILDITSIVLALIVSLGLIKISLNFCDNTKSKITDIFSQYKLFFRYLFASILFGLTILAGLILLIIPGIYLAIRLHFYGYFIVDKGSGIIESLKRSWAITRGSVWNLFLFDLLLGLINFLGILLPPLVGLFATVPTAMIAFAFVYRKLLAQSDITYSISTNG